VSQPPSIDDLKRFSFGDSPALADRLAALVVAGVKSATCSAAETNASWPPGERLVVLDGAGRPVAVIETVSADELAIEDVTPAQAAQEGEGDLSHAYWRDAHLGYFQREGTYKPGMRVLFETFRLVKVLDQEFAAQAAQHVESERAEAHASGYTALGVAS
jgi:uncharacterized protein YhfF